MKKNVFYLVAAVLLLTLPMAGFSQLAPDLKTAAKFVLYNANGEFTCNSPSAIVVGDVGNVAGAVTAFPPGFLSGHSHYDDAVAIQVGTDVADAYADLAGRPCGTVHPVGFGSGETITPGVYCAGAASTLDGNMTLDAGNVPNSVFIIDIDGAFASVAGSQIILTNGALSCNVFWQINGAVALNNTVFKGTLIANGAVHLNDGTIVDGRAFSKTGALIFGSVLTSLCDASLLPLQLVNFDVAKTRDDNVVITWITTAEVNLSVYEVQASINGNTFFTVGTAAPKGNNLPTRYSLEDRQVNKWGVRFYRLKMVDKDGTISYSAIKSIKFSDLKPGLVNIFPNPAGNKITITANAEGRENYMLTITNMQGQKLMQKLHPVEKGINNFEEDIHNLSTGTYIVSMKNIVSAKETWQKLQKL